MMNKKPRPEIRCVVIVLALAVVWLSVLSCRNAGTSPQTVGSDSLRLNIQKTNGGFFLKRNAIVRATGYSYLDAHDYEIDSTEKGSVLKILPDYRPVARKGDAHSAIVLSTPQIDTLLSIIDDKRSYKDAKAFCYYPRNCFCFYDKTGAIIGFYEICFECGRVESLPDFKNRLGGGLTDLGNDRLSAFCRSLQMKMQ